MLSKAKTLKGYTLHGLDGEIGKVKEFYFDDRHWTIRYLVADTGNWLTDRQVLISPYALGAVNKEERYIAIDLTKKQIEDSPSLHSDVPVSRQFEEGYIEYYGWPMYWSGPYAWGHSPYPVRDREKRREFAQGEKAWDSHLRSSHDVSGYHIHAADGEIGHVEDFIIDDETWAIRYLIIDTRNWWPGKRSWFHRNGSSALVGASRKSSSIFPARPSGSHRNTGRSLCQLGPMRPNCTCITTAWDTGSRNRLPSSIPVEANARKGLLTCVTCSIVKRRRWSPPGRCYEPVLRTHYRTRPYKHGSWGPKRLTRSSWKMDAGIIPNSGRHPHDALCSGTSCPTGLWLDRRVSHDCQGQTTMLVTPENNRRNRNHAFAIAGATAVAAAVAGWFWPPVLLSLGLCPVLYWLVRRRCLRRLKIMKQPFPASWEQILQSHVAFFRALPDPKKERFRQLVMVFLDEVRITGIRTNSTTPFGSWWPPVRQSPSSGSTIGNTIDWVKCSSTPTRSGRTIRPRERRRAHSWHGRPAASSRCDDSFQAVSPRRIRHPVEQGQRGYS